MAAHPTGKKIYVNIVKIVSPVEYLALRTSDDYYTTGEFWTYSDLFTGLNDYYENWSEDSQSDFSKEDFFIGDLVAVFNDQAQKWCRGKIQALYDRGRYREATVYLLDYATEIRVRIQRLKRLHAKFSNHQFRAVSLQLENLVPISLQIQVQTALTVDNCISDKWDIHAMTFVSEEIKVYNKFKFEISQTLLDGSLVGRLYLIKKRNVYFVECCLNELLIEHNYAVATDIDYTLNGSLHNWRVSPGLIRSYNPVQAGQLLEKNKQAENVVKINSLMESPVKPALPKVERKLDDHLINLNRLLAFCEGNSSNSTSKNIALGRGAAIVRSTIPEVEGREKVTKFSVTKSGNLCVARTTPSQLAISSKEPPLQQLYCQNDGSLLLKNTEEQSPKAVSASSSQTRNSIDRNSIKLGYFQNTISSAKQDHEILKTSECSSDSELHHKILNFGENIPAMVKSLDIDEWLMDNLRTMNIKQFSSSQLHMWPAVLTLRDVVLINDSESNIAVSYLLPLIWLLMGRMGRLYDDLPNIGPIVLVLCSNWKTAEGTYSVCKNLLYDNRLIQVRLLHSGLPKDQKMSMLSGSYSILITTPIAFIRQLEAKGVKLTGFGQLCHLVLADIDNLLDNFPDEVEKIVNLYAQAFNSRKRTRSPHQIIAISSTWTAKLYAFMKHEMKSTLFYCMSFFEALVYSKVKTEVYTLELDKRKKAVLDMLNPVISSQNRKVVICSNRDEDLFEIYNVLNRCCSSTFIAHSRMNDDELKQVRKCWSFLERFGIILISDSCLKALRIYDADWIVNYNIPRKTRSDLAIRFMCLLNHIQKMDCLKRNNLAVAPECKVHLIVTTKCYYQSHGIIRLLKRLGSEVPSKLEELCLGFYEGKEIMKEGDNFSKSLCFNLKSFGRCHNLYWCQERHLLLETVDAPSKLYLVDTRVKLIVTCVRNVSHFFGRILNYKTENGTFSSVESKYKKIKGDVAYYYAKPNNIKPLNVQNIQIGDLAAVKDEDHNWHRVQVISKPPERFKHSPKLEVLYIDEGRVEKIPNSHLKVLPEQFRESSELMEIFLCDVSPPDKEYEWYPSQIAEAKLLLENRLLYGKVMLSVGNTLWINPVITIIETELNNYVRDFDVNSRFERENLVMKNPSHMPSLTKFIETVFPVTTTSSTKTSSSESKPSSQSQSPGSLAQGGLSTTTPPLGPLLLSRSLPSQASPEPPSQHSSSLRYEPLTQSLPSQSPLIKPSSQPGIIVASSLLPLSSPSETFSSQSSSLPHSSMSSPERTAAIGTPNYISSSSLMHPVNHHLLAPTPTQSTLTLNKLENVYVSALDHPHHFYVQKVASFKILNKLKSKLKKDFNYMKPVSLEDVRESQFPCFAVSYLRNNERMYCRGQYQGYGEAEEKIEIINVDDGKVELVNLEDVRYLGPKYLKLEFQAIECRLQGVKSLDEDGNWNDEVGNRMWSLTLDQNKCKKMMVVRALSETNGCYDVELFDNSKDCTTNLADLLYREGLVKNAADDMKEVTITEVSDSPIPILTSSTSERDLAQADSPNRDNRVIPEVLWSDTKKIVRLKIKISGIKDHTLEINSNHLLFRTTVQNIEYQLNDTLYAAVESLPILVKKELFYLSCIFNKVETGKWPRLLECKTKMKWLKPDMDNCCTSSEEESDDSYKDQSQFDWNAVAAKSISNCKRLKGGKAGGEETESETEYDISSSESEDGDYYKP